MTIYQDLAELVRDDPGNTFRDEWMAFANWEAVRYFHDDPSRVSKDAIQWILDLNDLCIRLENDYQGPGKERCLAGLESAFVAFSQLDLPDELRSAIGKWRAHRLEEKRTKDESTTIGEDLFS